MGFQLSYAAEADVPEAVKAVYVLKGDRWVADIDGVIPQTEFDDYKTAAQKRLDEARGKAAGTTKDDVAAMIAEALKGRKPPPAGDDKDAERRIAALEAEKKTAADERDAAVQRFNRQTMDSQIMRAATTGGVLPEMIELVTREASRFVELSDKGEVRTLLDSPFGADKNAEALIAAMKDSPSYKPFWPESKGGGGRPGGGGPPSNDDNPWMAETWSVLKQQMLMGSDLPKAEALAKKAKVSLMTTLHEAKEAQK